MKRLGRVLADAQLTGPAGLLGQAIAVVLTITYGLSGRSLDPRLMALLGVAAVGVVLLTWFCWRRGQTMVQQRLLPPGSSLVLQWLSPTSFAYGNAANPPTFRAAASSRYGCAVASSCSRCGPAPCSSRSPGSS